MRLMLEIRIRVKKILDVDFASKVRWLESE